METKTTINGTEITNSAHNPFPGTSSKRWSLKEDENKRKTLLEDNSFSTGLVITYEFLCYQLFNFKPQKET